MEARLKRRTRKMECWIIWALLAAVFAALTAIFGKIGVTGVHPDLATFIRTCVILGFAALNWAGVGLIALGALLVSLSA